MSSSVSAEQGIVALRFAEGQDVRELRSEEGSIVFWKITSTVYATAVEGYLSRDMARLIIREAGPMYRAGAVAGFHDWFQMTGYDSGSRIDLTNWVMGHRTESRLFIGTRSKLVAMGVSVANLALGNMIESHSSPATLEAALDRLLESRGR